MRIKEYIRESAYAADWKMIETREEQLYKDISKFEDMEYNFYSDAPIRTHLEDCRKILIEEKKWLTRRRDEIILKAEADMKANIYSESLAVHLAEEPGLYAGISNPSKDV